MDHAEQPARVHRLRRELHLHTGVLCVNFEPVEEYLKSRRGSTRKEIHVEPAEYEFRELTRDFFRDALAPKRLHA